MLVKCFNIPYDDMLRVYKKKTQKNELKYFCNFYGRKRSFTTDEPTKKAKYFVCGRQFIVQQKNNNFKTAFAYFRL